MHPRGRGSLSSTDSNDNVKSQCNSDDSGEAKYKFDFLVWHCPSNRSQADRIYAEMEVKGMRGYIADRDSVLGQDKLTATKEAMKNTAYIILLMSNEALSCMEFTCNMHASIDPENKDKVIPIYVGMKKGDRPRHLNSYVDTQYKDQESSWERLHKSIARPIKPIETREKMVGSSKPFKEPRPANSSPLSQSRPSRPITLVPDATRSRQPASRTELEKQHEGRSRWFSFLTRKKEPEEPQDIPLRPVSTRKEE